MAWSEEQRKKHAATIAARKAEKEAGEKTKVERKRATKRKPMKLAKVQRTESDVLEKLEKAFEALTLVESIGWDLVRTLNARIGEG